MSVQKKLDSLKHAVRGIRDFLTFDLNARIKFVVAIILVVLGFLFELSYSEWISVVICIGLFLFAEAMNTAIEEICDEVTLERRERIRRAKDISAGAVLFCSITTGVVLLLMILRRYGV
jgi:diacylglycerol kinase